jgi:hypothetical protein
MSTSAWITTIIIGIILYGGLGLCIRIAMRKTREQKWEE